MGCLGKTFLVSYAHYVQRVLANSFFQVICIDSDDDGDFVEMMPSLPNYKRKASSEPEPFKTVGGEFKSERMPSKRPKHAKEEKTNLQASALPSSSEGSTKGSDNESKIPRKPRLHKFTNSQLKQFGDDEGSWFAAVSKGCDDLTRLVTKQTECIGSFGIIDSDIGRLINELAADAVSRSKRMQIQKQLADLEKKRLRKSTELREGAFSTLGEAFVIKQDCKRWHAKEQTITQLIEKCR